MLIPSLQYVHAAALTIIMAAPVQSSPKFPYIEAQPGRYSSKTYLLLEEEQPGKPSKEKPNSICKMEEKRYGARLILKASV